MNRDFRIEHREDKSILQEFLKLLHEIYNKRRRLLYAIEDDTKRMDTYLDLEMWRGDKLYTFVQALAGVGRPGTNAVLRMSHEGIDSLHDWAWLSDDRESATYVGGIRIRRTDEDDIQISSHS